MKIGEDLSNSSRNYLDDLDNDCNGLTDEADENLVYRDNSLNILPRCRWRRFTVESDSVSTCIAPEGYIGNRGG